MTSNTPSINGQKKWFLKNVLNKFSDVGNDISSAVDTAKMGIGTAIENLKNNRNQGKLAVSTMDKYYPAQTVTSKNGAWQNRYKQTLNTIKQGNAAWARSNLQNLTAQFKKDNPNYQQ